MARAQCRVTLHLALVIVKHDADWSVVRRAMKRSEEIDEEGPLLGGLYFSAYFSLLGEKSKTNLKNLKSAEEL